MPRIIVRRITPKRSKLLNFQYFEQEFRRVVEKESKPRILKNFRGTVEGWNNKPDFFARTVITRDKVAIDVTPRGPHKDQYLLVSRGARAHIIRPRRRGGRLAFRASYRSATRPRSIKSRRKQVSGPTVFARAVRHPGFEGRDFFTQIGELEKVDFKRDAENAIRRAIRRNR